MNKPIYLDHNATTPLDPEVFEAMKPFFLEHFGNSSSRHEYGWLAAQAVEKARGQVATLLGCLPKEIIFTSGATESNNLSLRGVLSGEKNQIITSNIEHKSVLEVVEDLEKSGCEVVGLEVNQAGLVLPQQVSATLSERTALVSLIFGNNEIGTLFPIAEIGAITRERNVFLHVDATQAVGHVSVNVNELHVDLLSLSAHKFHGPKGVGALYVRSQNPRVKLKPLSVGGGQEMGLRPGTLNVPGIVGLGKACELAGARLGEESACLSGLRDHLQNQILAGLTGVQVNGDRERRLPHCLSLTFQGVSTQSLLGALTRVMAVSAGSACTNPTAEPSHVLKAIGLSVEEARSTLRFGLGRFTTEDEISRAAIAVVTAVQKLR